MPFAIIGPFEGEDFVAAAPGQEQQPDGCGLKRMIRFMPVSVRRRAIAFLPARESARVRTFDIA